LTIEADSASVLPSGGKRRTARRELVKCGGLLDEPASDLALAKDIGG